MFFPLSVQSTISQWLDREMHTGKRRSSDISPEKLEQIQAETEVRTAWEQKSYFRGKLIFITIVAVVSLLIWLVILWLS